MVCVCNSVSAQLRLIFAGILSPGDYSEQKIIFVNLL